VRHSRVPYARRWPRRFEGLSVNLSALPGAAFMSGAGPVFLTIAAGLTLFGAITLAVGFAHHSTSVVVASLLCNGFALVPVALFLGFCGGRHVVDDGSRIQFGPNSSISGRFGSSINLPTSPVEPMAVPQADGPVSPPCRAHAASTSAATEPTVP
jgi:hypothetical protein